MLPPHAALLPTQLPCWCRSSVQNGEQCLFFLWCLHTRISACTSCQAHTFFSAHPWPSVFTEVTPTRKDPRRDDTESALDSTVSVFFPDEMCRHLPEDCAVTEFAVNLDMTRVNVNQEHVYHPLHRPKCESAEMVSERLAVPGIPKVDSRPRQGQHL